jgi:hypothetical protein
MATVTVKADWMADCGYPHKDTPVEVLRVLPRKLGGFGQFYEVAHPYREGTWMVCDLRLVKEQQA